MWSRLMSTPSLLPRVSAARPSGLAVGTTSTVVRSQAAAGSRASLAYARSRTVVRQASRPGRLVAVLAADQQHGVWRRAGADADELQRAVLFGRADPVDRHAVARPVDGGEEVLLLGLAGPAGAVGLLESGAGRGGSAAWAGDRQQGYGERARAVSATAMRSGAGCISGAASGMRGGSARGSPTPSRRGVAGCRDERPAVARAKAAAPPTSGTCADVRDRSSVSVGVLDGGSMRSCVGAGDDQREAVARRDDVVARVQVEGDRVRLARGERDALGVGGVVAEVGPAAAEDRVVDVRGLGPRSP